MISEADLLRAVAGLEGLPCKVDLKEKVARLARRTEETPIRAVREPRSGPTVLQTDRLKSHVPGSQVLRKSMSKMGRRLACGAKPSWSPQI